MCKNIVIHPVAHGVAAVVVFLDRTILAGLLGVLCVPDVGRNLPQRHPAGRGEPEPELTQLQGDGGNAVQYGVLCGKYVREAVVPQPCDKGAGGRVNDNGNVLPFANVSSGLQSLIPLYIHLVNITSKKYREQEDNSVKHRSDNEKLTDFLIDYYDEKTETVVDGWFIGNNETDEYLLMWIPKARTNHINRLVAEDFICVNADLLQKKRIQDPLPVSYRHNCP